MKKKNRDRLLIDVLRAMRHCPDDAKRYTLQCIGEGLVKEWKDMSVSKTKKELAGLTK